MRFIPRSFGMASLMDAFLNALLHIEIKEPTLYAEVLRS